jgi:3',5'-cyclic AMP phosphodiesterase CpdA
MNRRQFLALASAAVATLAPCRAQTVPPEAPLVSFGLLTDVQYADADPQGERHYRDSLPKLRAAAADLSKEKLAFALHLGDLIDHDFASFAAILPAFQGLGKPVHHLLGNHDCAVPDADKGKVVATLGMPSDYYTFSDSGVKFVMLDTNDVSVGKYPQGSARAQAAEATLKQLAATQPANAQPWNGGISPAQLEWLDKELAAAEVAKVPVIVCSHHPLLPEDAHQVWNSGEVVALLDRHRCVRAYLSGHNHAGTDVIHQGVPYVTFKSLLHEPQVTAYAVVRLFKDHLVIEGRGREKSRSFPLPALVD